MVNINEERNRDALIAHIQALDTVIRNRNNEIAKLRQIIAGEVIVSESDAVQKKIDRAYTKGWKDAYKAMAIHLRESFSIYHLSAPPVKGEK